MQTFLPYPDFRESAHTLDPKRLGNQVYREALTLYRGGWRNHPASLMWRGYRHALCQYSLACLAELRDRGRPYPHWERYFKREMYRNPDTGMPHWLGDERLHLSHRSALVSKDKDWYVPLFGELPIVPYYWPVQSKPELPDSL